MEAHTFTAKAVVLELPDDEFYFVGFADHEYTPTTYLQFQRAFEFDEQDVRLGMDTYDIEWCDQGASTYGGVATFELGPTSAVVRLTDQGAEALGLDEITIHFTLTPARHAALKTALEEIFEGTDCLVMADR